MSDPLNANGDALSAYRYAVLGQAGIAVTFEQLLDQQAASHPQATQPQSTASPAATGNDSINISGSPGNSITEAQSILQRMRSLSFQAASGTSTSGSSSQIQQTLSQLQAQLDEVAAATRTAADATDGVITTAQAKNEVAKVASDLKNKNSTDQQAAKKKADQAADATSSDDSVPSARTGSKKKTKKRGAGDVDDPNAGATDEAQSLVSAARGQLSEAARRALAKASVSAASAKALLRD